MRLQVLPLILCASIWAWGEQLTPEAWEDLEQHYQYPDEEALIPAYTLGDGHRDEILEQLSVIRHYYHVRQTKLRAEHMGYSSVPEFIVGTSMLDMDPGMRDVARELHEIRAPLRADHESWFIELGQDALGTDPVDWRMVMAVLYTVRMAECKTEFTNLAHEVLRRPLPEELTYEQRRAIAVALRYLILCWNDDTSDILTTLVTLPGQPLARDFLPAHADGPRPEEAERRLSHMAAVLMVRLLKQHYPDRTRDMLERIDNTVEALGFTLHDETQAELETLRKGLPERED